MEGGALLEEAFTAFAKDYVLFCHVTTGIDGAKDDDLLGKKGGDGFPHLAFLDAEGTVLAIHSGRRNVEGFARTGVQARAAQEIRKKAAAGDPAAKADWALVRLEMGLASVDETDADLRGLALTGAQAKKLESLKVNAEVRAIASKIEDEPSRAAASRTFYEMRKKGGPSPTGPREWLFYWNGLLDHAEKAKDAAVFEEALKALKEKFGAEKDNEDFFRDKEEALRKLKEGGK